MTDIVLNLLRASCFNQSFPQQRRSEQEDNDVNDMVASINQAKTSGQAESDVCQAFLIKAYTALTQRTSPIPNDPIAFAGPVTDNHGYATAHAINAAPDR